MAATAVGQPDMRQFYKQSDFADVTIKFGDKKIPAHRVILCARSTYFKKALGPASPFQVHLPLPRVGFQLC